MVLSDTGYAIPIADLLHGSYAIEAVLIAFEGGVVRVSDCATAGDQPGACRYNPQPPGIITWSKARVRCTGIGRLPHPSMRASCL